MKNIKETSRKKRKVRIRKKIRGPAERPRLTIFRSSRSILLQVIDDATGTTLAAATTLEKDLRVKFKNNNMKAATEIATIMATRAKEKGITKMVFDRNGYLYHGRIKQIAESLREHGIQI